jgi:hypothetical protein
MPDGTCSHGGKVSIGENHRSLKMERKIEVRHVSLEIDADFDSFTQTLEQALGRFDNSLI